MAAPHVAGWVAEYRVQNGKSDLTTITKNLINSAWNAQSANGWDINSDRDNLHEPLLNAIIPIVIPPDPLPVTVNLPFGYSTIIFEDNGNTIIFIQTNVILAIIIDKDGETLFFGDLRDVPSNLDLKSITTILEELG